MFRLSILGSALVVALFCSPLTSSGAEPVSPRNANGSIIKAIPQPDAKVIIVGNFSYIGTVERVGIARLNADGTLDRTFDAGAGANGAINLVALQSDGKILIAGSFTAVAGTPRAGMARLHPDGKLDSSFDPGTGADAEILDLLVDASDRAVLAGAFENFNAVARRMLVRLNVNGSVDQTFDAGKNFTRLSGGLGRVRSVSFYPGGQLIAAGIFRAGNNSALVRVAVDGTVDDSFRPSAASNALVVAQPDGRVIVGDGVVNNNSSGLVRLDADGMTDITFRGGANRPSVVRLQPDGRILVLDLDGLRRLMNNGTADPTFVRPQIASGRSDPARLTGVELQADGRMIIYGSFARVNDAPRVGVARLLPDGSVDPSFVPAPTIIATGFLLNLSTRVPVGTGDRVLIGGFIVQGTEAKKLMIRAIGPSLASSAAAVPSPLADPRLMLRDASGSAIAQNDDWRTTQVGGVITGDQVSAIEASGIAPRMDAESAMIVSLTPGAYTATVEGDGGGTALVELYDLDGSTATRVKNISTRGRVGTGDDVMIGGAILGGPHRTEVLVRALGPSLTASGVSGALEDPTLELYNADGSLVGTNEDWKDDQESDIRSTEAAPTHDREAAILRVLQPGSYTAVVRGRNQTTGVALVEFYAL